MNVDLLIEGFAKLSNNERRAKNQNLSSLGEAYPLNARVIFRSTDTQVDLSPVKTDNAFDFY